MTLTTQLNELEEGDLILFRTKKIAEKNRDPVLGVFSELATNGGIWCKNGVLRLRSPEKYVPSKSPVSNCVARYRNITELDKGLDLIISRIRSDFPSLESHINGISSFEEPYDFSLLSYRTDNLSTLIPGKGEYRNKPKRDLKIPKRHIVPSDCTMGSNQIISELKGELCSGKRESIAQYLSDVEGIALSTARSYISNLLSGDLRRALSVSSQSMNDIHRRRVGYILTELGHTNESPLVNGIRSLNPYFELKSLK